jgi:hypothetical protein
MIDGILHKMIVDLKDKVQYVLKDKDGNAHLMNDWIGKSIKLEFQNQIICQKCQKQTKNSFGQGFCYPCFSTAPEAAECIIKPELCRAHLGEGRDIEWEERNHNQPHVVYFAATDIVKVGVTRETQIPTRWIDQGASSAIRLAVTPNRYEAGRLEVALKDLFSDKTNWRKMLKNEIDENIDLVEEKWELHDSLPADLTEFFTEDDEIISIEYPVDEFPEKVVSVSFDKTPIIEGVLKGIKGQYLLLDNNRVLNIRKHTGYKVVIH